MSKRSVASDSIMISGPQGGDCWESSHDETFIPFPRAPLQKTPPKVCCDETILTPKYTSLVWVLCSVLASWRWGGPRLEVTDLHGLQGVPQGGQRRFAARGLGACSHLSYSASSASSAAAQIGCALWRLKIRDRLGWLASPEVHQVRHPGSNSDVRSKRRSNRSVALDMM